MSTFRRMVAPVRKTRVNLEELIIVAENRAEGEGAHPDRWRQIANCLKRARAETQTALDLLQLEVTR